MSELNHFNAAGEAHMVDVGDKPVSRRRAIAQGRINMQPDTLTLIQRAVVARGMCSVLRALPVLWPRKKPPSWCRCATHWR